MVNRTFAFLLLAATPALAQAPPQAIPEKIIVIPPREDAPQIEPGSEIPLLVEANGTVVLESRTLTREKLAERLSSLSKQNAKQLILLRVKADTPYQTVTEILDLCQKSGISNISFDATLPEAAK